MLFDVLVMLIFIFTAFPLLILNLLFIAGHILERWEIEQEWKEAQKKN